MKIKRFYEQDTFLPLKDQKRVYYKLHVNNSIPTLEIILTKLGIKKMFDKFYDFDIENYRKKIESNSVIYLLIDFYQDDQNMSNYNIDIITDEKAVNPIYDNFYSRNYGGEVFATDYEVSSNKYNL